MKRLLSLLLLSLLVSSCGRVRPPCWTMTPSQKVSRLPQETNAVFVRGDWPDCHWWETFDDTQLNCLIERGLANNPNLASTKARAAEAMALAESTRSFLMPQLTFTAEDQWVALSKNGLYRGFFNFFPANFNDTTLSLNFSYDLDIFGRNKMAYLAALDNAMARKVEIQQSSLLLAGHIATTYFQLQAYYEALSVQKMLLAKTTANFHLTANAQTAGLATDLSLDSSEVVEVQMKEEILLIEQMIAIQEHMLRVLIGEGPVSCTPICPRWQFAEKTLSVPCDLPLNILYHRPDLRAQLWYIGATSYAIGVAKAEFLPNVNLAALGGLDSIHFGQLFSLSSLTGQLLPSLSLPIFNGGRLQANLDLAVDLKDDAVAIYNSLLLKAIQEVADQISIIATQKKQLQEIERLMQLKEKNRALYEQQKSVGLGTEISVNQSEIAYYQQRLQQIALQNQQYTAYVNLLTALGGGFTT